MVKLKLSAQFKCDAMSLWASKERVSSRAFTTRPSPSGRTSVTEIHVQQHTMPTLLYYFSPKTSTISTLLSQYELLKSLCENLSSADMIHLAATCKAHWIYVASSKPILDLLMSSAQCDGTGIVAQARVFSCFRGNASNAKQKCLGAAAKPCSSCGAHVCDVCCPICTLTLLLKCCRTVAFTSATSTAVVPWISLRL